MTVPRKWLKNTGPPVTRSPIFMTRPKRWQRRTRQPVPPIFTCLTRTIRWSTVVSLTPAGRGNGKPVTGSDLRLAVDTLLAGKSPLVEQRPSIGCNIKWIAGHEPQYFHGRIRRRSLNHSIWCHLSLCHWLTVFGQSVLFEMVRADERHCVGEDSDAVECGTNVVSPPYRRPPAADKLALSFHDRKAEAKKPQIVPQSPEIFKDATQVASQSTSQSTLQSRLWATKMVFSDSAILLRSNRATCCPSDAIVAGRQGYRPPLQIVGVRSSRI